MKKRVRQIIRFAAFLALGILLLYLAFRGIHLSDIKAGFSDTKWAWVLVSFLFAILSHISRARRWVLLIQPLHFRPSLWNTFNAVMFGYLANFAFPRVGEISRCVALGRKERIPANALIGTVIVERAFDMLMLLIIMVILLISSFETFGNFFTNYIVGPMQDKIAALFGGVWILWMLLAVLFIVALIFAIIYRERLSRFKLFKKAGELVKGIVEGLKSVTHLERKWEFIFHTLFIWVCYAMMTWVMVFALPGKTDHLSFTDGIFLLVVGSMGMAAPVQSGIGAFHWLVSRGLHYVYGLTLTDGLVFATLQHESQSLLVLIIGSFSMIFIFAGRRKKEHNP